MIGMIQNNYLTFSVLGPIWIGSFHCVIAVFIFGVWKPEFSDEFLFIHNDKE